MVYAYMELSFFIKNNVISRRFRSEKSSSKLLQVGGFNYGFKNNFVIELTKEKCNVILKSKLRKRKRAK